MIELHESAELGDVLEMMRPLAEEIRTLRERIAALEAAAESDATLPTPDDQETTT